MDIYDLSFLVTYWPSEIMKGSEIPACFSYAER